MASGGNSPAARSGLDKLYADNFVVAIILSVCCGIVGLILSLITMLTTKDPVAKKNATICVIIPIVLGAIGVLLNFLGVLGGLAGR